MFRRDLIAVLKARPISLHELAPLLDERPRDLEDDLEHLFRSLRKDPVCPIITPASCRKCGFRFDEHKLHKPGKCPRCRGTWISEPLISLEEKRLSLGLRAVKHTQELMERNSQAIGSLPSLGPRLERLMHYAPLIDTIEGFWLEPANRSSRTWKEHEDINAVMLTTSLAPDSFLAI